MKTFLAVLIVAANAVAAFYAGQRYERPIAFADGFRTSQTTLAARCEKTVQGHVTGVMVDVKRGDGQMQKIFISDTLSDRDELVVSHRVDEKGSIYGAWWWLPLSTLKRDANQ